MKEMINNEVIMKEISHRIVDENQLREHPRLLNRLDFFYNYIIDGCLEDKPEYIRECIDEICEFESKWYSDNIHGLHLFEDTSILNCLSLFRIISYQLARDKINGREYQFINVFLESLFNGFSEAISKQYYLIEDLSDIGLNFSYACGYSDIMSLPLYNYMVNFNEGGE